MQLTNTIHFCNLGGDPFGGVTAVVIALPMALAFGVASGAGAAAGLWGTALVGFFAALFSGTSTLISEPTGPMTIVMLAGLFPILSGPMIFGVAKAIAREHNAIGNCHAIVFDLDDVPHLGVTASIAIENAVSSGA